MPVSEGYLTCEDISNLYANFYDGMYSGSKNNTRSLFFPSFFCSPFFSFPRLHTAAEFITCFVLQPWMVKGWCIEGHY